MLPDGPAAPERRAPGTALLRRFLRPRPMHRIGFVVMERSNGMSHRIRPLEPADLETVVDLSLRAWEPVFVSFEKVLGSAIFNGLYRPDWRSAQAASVRQHCLADGAESFILATDDGAAAGFVVLRPDREESLGIIEMIAVHPGHQRRGHGRALMEFAIQRLSDQGFELVNVGTGGDPGHAPARALYEALGFTGLPLVNYYRGTGRAVPPCPPGARQPSSA
ncbi:GNAT family N-acetyltransferase [Actinoplanes sp. CA-054009]